MDPAATSYCSVELTNSISEILFISDRTATKTNSYIQKFSDMIIKHDIPNTNIMTLNIRDKLSISQTTKIQILIAGWGADGIPQWGHILNKFSSILVKHFLGFDLNERTILGDSYFSLSPELAKQYWGNKVQRGQQKLYANGNYLRCTAPYGLEKEQLPHDKGKKTRKKLVPGDPEKVEIVRLIFNLFAIHDYPVTKICNLLSSQKIESPGTSNHWTWSNVKKILENYAYIGANQFLNNIQFDVFPGIIDKSVFFLAQAKIHKEYVTKFFYQTDIYR